MIDEALCLLLFRIMNKEKVKVLWPTRNCASDGGAESYKVREKQSLATRIKACHVRRAVNGRIDHCQTEAGQIVIVRELRSIKVHCCVVCLAQTKIVDCQGRVVFERSNAVKAKSPHVLNNHVCHSESKRASCGLRQEVKFRERHVK